MTPKPQMPDIFALTAPREAEPTPPALAKAALPVGRAESASLTRPTRKAAAAPVGAMRATQVRLDAKTQEHLDRITELARRKGRDAVSNSAIMRWGVALMVEQMSDKEIVANCPVPTRVTVIQ